MVPVMSERQLLDGAELLSAKEAAELIGVSTRTLARYVEAGKVPFTTLPSGHRRYRVADLLATVGDAA